MNTHIDKNIIETLALAAKYPSIRRVGVFGSYAKGTANGGSDIDLLYDYDETLEQSTDDILGYIEEINDTLLRLTHAPKIDYVWYKGVLESGNAKFRNEVLRDVTWLYL